MGHIIATGVSDTRDTRIRYQMAVGRARSRGQSPRDPARSAGSGWSGVGVSSLCLSVARLVGFPCSVRFGVASCAFSGFGAFGGLCASSLAFVVPSVVRLPAVLLHLLFLSCCLSPAFLLCFVLPPQLFCP